MPDAPPRAEGMITTYYPNKGYGFVTTFDLAGDSTDVFFHISELPGFDRVKEKWRIEFSPDFNHGEDGWEARDAWVISKETKPGATSPERKPWYQRKEAEEASKAGSRNLGIKKTSTVESDEEDVKTRTKYDQSDHV